MVLNEPRGHVSSTPADPDLLMLLSRLTDGLTTELEMTDVADSLIEGCLRHTAAQAAGILVTDQAGRLRVLAHSGSVARGLELLELQAEEGPCIDAYRSGHTVSSRDLLADQARWPRFAPEARNAGVSELHSLPLRLRERTIGALNLFVMGEKQMPPSDLVLAEILAGAAALGIITRQQIDEHVELARQLQSALHSRVVIEQAKGVIAARTGFDMAAAFEVIRRQARHERRPLRVVAEEIVGRMSGH